MADGGEQVAIRGARVVDEEELRVAVEEAAAHGTHVAAHAHSAEGIATEGRRQGWPAEAWPRTRRPPGPSAKASPRPSRPGCGSPPGDPLADLELLADLPFVMQGGRVLKWEGQGPRAGLSAAGPYSSS